MYAKSETTIANILDSAEQLFVAGSFDSVSMQEIAELANVSKGALYHHFDGKEELYVAMLGRDLERKRVLLSEAIDMVGSARERLRNLTYHFLQLPPLKRQLIQLVRRDANCFDGETREAIVRAYQAALPDQIEAVIEGGIAAGEIVSGDARLLAWSFVALVEVALTQYGESVFSEIDQMLEHVLQLFFSGAGAPEFERVTQSPIGGN